MPTPQDLARKATKTLLLELDIISGEEPTSNALNITDVQSYHGGFFTHEVGKVKTEPTKEALLEDMFQNKQSTIAFCCASLKTDTKLTFDIDHVFPRDRITKKQELLLNYLNKSENDVFSKAFMGEAPQDVDLEQKIGKYFKRDPKDNKIQATRWFIDVCYNNLSNLFHLKNYLNRGKSAATPKE